MANNKRLKEFIAILEFKGSDWLKLILIACIGFFDLGLLFGIFYTTQVLLGEQPNIPVFGYIYLEGSILAYISILFFLGLIFSFYGNYQIYRIGYRLGVSLSNTLARKYLQSMPLENTTYSFSNTDVISVVFQEVSRVTNGILIPGLNLIAKLINIIIISVAALLIEFQMTIILLCAAIIFYLSIFIVVRPLYVRNSSKVSVAVKARVGILNEYSSGIKDILLYELQSKILESFKEPGVRQHKAEANSSILSLAPKIIVDYSIFGILIFALYLYSEGSLAGSGGIVTVSIAFLKLTPLINQVYVAFSSFFSNITAVDRILEFREVLSRSTFIGGGSGSKLIEHKSEPNECLLKFDNVGFSYKKNSMLSFEVLHLELRRGVWVSVVGKSGSGKSTLVDLCLGFLTPTQGSVIWAAGVSVGYVGQIDFIFKGTIRDNLIAAKEDLSDKFLLQCLRDASFDLEEVECSGWLDYEITPLGSNLSGGQKKRLMLARALSHSPDLLILDEVSSGLDYGTEQALLEGLNKIKMKAAILSITHSRPMAKSADLCFELRRGRLLAIE